MITILKADYVQFIAEQLPRLRRELAANDDWPKVRMPVATRDGILDVTLDRAGFCEIEHKPNLKKYPYRNSAGDDEC